MSRMRLLGALRTEIAPIGAIVSSGSLELHKIAPFGAILQRMCLRVSLPTSTCSYGSFRWRLRYSWGERPDAFLKILAK